VSCAAIQSVLCASSNASCSAKTRVERTAGQDPTVLKTGSLVDFENVFGDVLVRLDLAFFKPVVLREVQRSDYL
jgi:hypothetical protein